MSDAAVPDISLWHIAPACVGSVRVAEADADDDELLEAVWSAAHEAEPVDEWTVLRVRTGELPSTVLYVEEAEVLIYADALRAAVESVRGTADDHVWLPVTVESGGTD